ncbi:hypothetical protein BDR07DRAFT_1438221 [Suillus spraguei]|nr:hypothetical protein BDR07DRAFT_1438221 [Suillus spraguei]
MQRAIILIQDTLLWLCRCKRRQMNAQSKSFSPANSILLDASISPRPLVSFLISRAKLIASSAFVILSSASFILWCVRIMLCCASLPFADKVRLSSINWSFCLSVFASIKHSSLFRLSATVSTSAVDDNLIDCSGT